MLHRFLALVVLFILAAAVCLAMSSCSLIPDRSFDRAEAEWSRHSDAILDRSHERRMARLNLTQP